MGAAPEQVIVPEAIRHVFWKQVLKGNPSMMALTIAIGSRPQEVTMSFQREYAEAYHIELLEKLTIVWDFHSLLLAIQMMFSFMLTDEQSSLKVCKHCGKVFLASRPNTVLCSGQCKNQYNVYKSRRKDKEK